MAPDAPPSGTFDWHLSLRAHPQLRPWLLPSAHKLPFEARVLNVGCGDSTLSEDLWDAGYAQVTGVDIEERCIAAARARTADKPGLQWHTLDLAASTGLPAELGSFALALDKGTLDALVCAGDEAACRAVWNVRHALRPGGVLVVVTLHRDGKVCT
ncbi:S-adenosyl-L-methionine-dependent methyltransferase [Pavlovales sp. CCMP2436]|nr:S-adenosyl-L-methionine-dependent methyltransferase [Pavlovales sp. CCMP2436]|mmetsp:Transcript_50266/g.115316  ORF Transcript_50266/g.115316 Transcript_50266/m.115316 type:complete len:156 (+) Transcript_50266:68-535(+)